MGNEMSISLRPYQIDIINQTREHFKRGVRCVLIQLATGGGKTALCTQMIKTCTEKGIPSIFICHRRELLKQTSDTFKQFGIRHLMDGGCYTGKMPLAKITSIQKIVRRLNSTAKPGLIVFDEARHIAAKSWTKVYKAFPNSYIIGLDATPKRLDGSGLGEYFKVMVKGPTIQSLIDDGYLSKYKIYAPANIDTKGLHKRMGEFITSELDTLMDKPTIVGDAIKEYQKYANGKRAIVRGVSIKHSQHIAEQFNKAGIIAMHVDGETPHHIRDKAIQDFRNGKILILSNVELFSEGFDVPAVECVIDLRPTASLTYALQFWGRALRPSQGKEHAIIIDHVSNCKRHSLPCDEREWSLESKKKKEKEDTGPKIRLCQKCFAASQSWRKECPYCKTAFVIQDREVDQVAGELTEVDIIKARKERLRKQGQCRTYDELVAFGKEQGYPKAEYWAKRLLEYRKQKKDNW